MDILIKSFNRPYYLDRCIQSILDFVIVSKLKIIVLDDGTPEKYLKKIQNKYPFIVILKSEYYTEKTNLINNNSLNFIPKIPIDLWLTSAKKATDYFVLLEDDIWLKKSINLDKLEIDLKQKNLLMLKLYWLGNPKLIPTKILNKLNNIFVYKENLITKNRFLYKLIFHVQRLKINKIMIYLKINSEQRKLDYYHIYATAGAIFNREYFLKLWDKHDNEVNEYLQICNALKFIKNNKNCCFGFLENEIVKTGFVSAATNLYKNYPNIDINMFVLNKILNESWYNDKFNTTSEFDEDLKNSEIESILNYHDNKKAKASEWEKWTTAFRQQYKDFGCKID